eukprot:g7245.t1
MDVRKESKAAKKNRQRREAKAAKKLNTTTDITSSPHSHTPIPSLVSNTPPSLADSAESLRASPAKNVEAAIFATPLKTGAMVVRPNFGTLGRKINAVCNMFEISWATDVAIQYEVIISPVQAPVRGRGRGRGRGHRPAPQAPPKKLRPELCREVFSKAFQNGRLLPTGSSYDGQGILFVPNNALQDSSQRFVKIMVDGKQKGFTVDLRQTARIGLNQIYSYLEDLSRELPQSALAALDVTFRHVAAMDPTNSTVGCGIFKHDRLAKYISPGVQAWSGYKQCVYPCQNGVYLNLNTCFKPFLKQQTLVDFMTEVVSVMMKRRISPDQLHTVMTNMHYDEVLKRLSKLNDRLDRLKVKTIHDPNNVLYPKLGGFTRGTAQSTEFEVGHGRRVNVVQHMRNKCGYQVKYPNLRLMATLKKNAISNVAFPPECILIRSQRYKRELDEVQKSRLIQAATWKPKEKKQQIESYMKAQLTNAENANHLRALGIRVNDTMKDIEMRVLESPLIECGDGEVINVKEKGEWDTRDFKFVLPIKVKSWALVNFCGQDIQSSDLKTLIEDLQRVMNKKGMEVSSLPSKKDVTIKDISYTDQILKSAVDNAQAKFNAKCQIIMVVLPDIRGGPTTTDDLYERVKIVSDQLIGIPTQCLLAREFGLIRGVPSKNREPCLENLTKKMNAKMGGSHSILHTPPDRSRSFTYPLVGDKPFMVLGADLTHPPPTSDDPRSVVGIVGSLDPFLSQFACRGLVQEKSEKGREVILELKSAVKDLLLAFYRKNNGNKPEAILFYRDGVSQGEFQKVLDHEYHAIKQACSEMGDPGADYNPRVTFITVQKRHYKSFFASDEKDTDSSGNLVPGSIIDSQICNPHGFDFYLLSHAGVQGTSKAALYSVLADENKFDADSLQCLTYWMCYVFCRCTRSVSYCPPAYYAHHAAARCKILYLKAENEKQPVHENIKDTLFFI